MSNTPKPTYFLKQDFRLIQTLNPPLATVLALVTCDVGFSLSFINIHIVL